MEAATDTVVTVIPSRDEIYADLEFVRNKMASGDYYNGIEALERLGRIALTAADLNRLPELLAEEIRAMRPVAQAHGDFEIIEEALLAAMRKLAA